MTFIHRIVSIDGEITERPLNAEELEQMEKAHAAFLAAQKIDSDKIAAKMAVLEKLGLTEEEAQSLL